MTGLLRLLRDHAEAVEADLSRYFHVDYRNRWRRDDAGRRCLTLRMIRVRLRALPPDCAVAAAMGGSGWTLEHYLAADLFHAVAGKPHPLLPKPTVHTDPGRERRIALARMRASERLAAIAAGDIA